MDGALGGRREEGGVGRDILFPDRDSPRGSVRCACHDDPHGILPALRVPRGCWRRSTCWNAAYDRSATHPAEQCRCAAAGAAAGVRHQRSGTWRGSTPTGHESSANRGPYRGTAARTPGRLTGSSATRSREQRPRAGPNGARRSAHLAGEGSLRVGPAIMNRPRPLWCRVRSGSRGGRYQAARTCRTKKL